MSLFRYYHDSTSYKLLTNPIPANESIPRMMLANHRPDVFTYSSLLAAWHRCSSWELANDLLQKIGSEANIMSQSSMLTSFVKAAIFLGEMWAEKSTTKTHVFILIWCFFWLKHYTGSLSIWASITGIMGLVIAPRGGGDWTILGCGPNFLERFFMAKIHSSF